MRITRSTLDQTDKITGFQVGMQADHHYIHTGIGFNLTGATASIAAGASWALSFTTPTNVKYVHLRPTGLSSTANTLRMTLAENSVVSGGSAATPRNKNRNSSKTSLVTIATGITLTTEGTVLESFQVGSGTTAANASGGSGDGSANEWVLKPNTKYSFNFSNIGSTIATVGYYNLFWYEEGAGE